MGAESAAEVTATMQTKDTKKRVPCRINWSVPLDGGLGLQITSEDGFEYTARWKDVACIDLNGPKLFMDTLVVLDCQVLTPNPPESPATPASPGSPPPLSPPMLIKIWMSDLCDVSVFSKVLVSLKNDKLDIPCRPGALWSLTARPSFLPYYHRALTRIWSTVSALVDMLFLMVTVFMILQVLGMHDPGISDQEFPEKALAILHEHGSDMDTVRLEIRRLVRGLSEDDEKVLAKRWKRFGWEPTFVDNRILKRPEQAVSQLGERDWLARPARQLHRGWRWAWRWFDDTVKPFLSSHPYLLLLAFPAAPLIAGATMLLVTWAGLALVLYGVKHLSVFLLSINAVMLLKHVIFELRSLYTTFKFTLRMILDLKQWTLFACTVVWKKLMKPKKSRRAKAEKTEKTEKTD